MKKYYYAGMFGILLGTLTGIASATDSKTTVKKLPNGSTETCKFETDFATAKDGGLVVRTAWRCVTVKGK